MFCQSIEMVLESNKLKLMVFSTTEDFYNIDFEVVSINGDLNVPEHITDMLEVLLRMKFLDEIKALAKDLYEEEKYE